MKDSVMMTIEGLFFGSLIGTCLFTLLNQIGKGEIETAGTSDVAISQISYSIKLLPLLLPFAIGAAITRFLYSFKFKRGGSESPLRAWVIAGMVGLFTLYLTVFIRERDITADFTQSCCYESFNANLWLFLSVATILLSIAYGRIRRRFHLIDWFRRRY